MKHSAIYLATDVVNQIAEENITRYPETSKILQRHSYVDDLLSGENSVPEGIQLAEQLSNRIQSSKMVFQLTRIIC